MENMDTDEKKHVHKFGRWSKQQTPTKITKIRICLKCWKKHIVQYSIINGKPVLDFISIGGNYYMKGGDIL